MSDPFPVPPPLPRLKPPPLWRQTLDEHEDLEEGNQGIGGWLILFAIGRVLAPLIIGAALVKDLIIFTKLHVWVALTNPGSEAYHPLWSTIILYETTGNAILLLFSIVLVCLFFARWKAFTPLMASYLVLLPLFYLGEHLIGSQIPAIRVHQSDKTIGQMIGGIITALIWVPYLLTSARVRHTFVK